MNGMAHSAHKVYCTLQKSNKMQQTYCIRRNALHFELDEYISHFLPPLSLHCRVPSVCLRVCTLRECRMRTTLFFALPIYLSHIYFFRLFNVRASVHHHCSHSSQRAYNVFCNWLKGSCVFHRIHFSVVFISYLLRLLLQHTREFDKTRCVLIPAITGRYRRQEREEEKRMHSNRFGKNFGNICPMHERMSATASNRCHHWMAHSQVYCTILHRFFFLFMLLWQCIFHSIRFDDFCIFFVAFFDANAVADEAKTKKCSTLRPFELFALRQFSMAIYMHCILCAPLRGP